MEYNDFQLPNDKAFEIISNHLNNIKSYNKKENIISICSELNSSANMCATISEKYNLKIKQTIENVKNVLLKIFNNLSSTFNIKISNIRVCNFNIFSFLRNLLNIILLTNNWEQNETREYYHQLSVKSIKELIDCVKLVLLSLEESNIHFFKHM